MAAIDDIITKWIEGVKADLTKSYIDSVRKASGNWKDELEGKYEVNEQGIKVQILGSSYTLYMELGRGPNKKKTHKDLVKFAFGMSNKNDGPIYRWCLNKGISPTVAFPIAYKIGRDGYKGKPFLEKGINKSSIDNLINEIGLVLLTNVKSEILKTFN